MKVVRSLSAAAAVVLATAVPGRAQGTDVPQRFWIELGGFSVTSDTDLRLSSQRLGGTTISFEEDLDLPDRSNRGFLELFWRAGRRHLISVNVSRLHRDGPGRTIQREINWGDTVFPVGATLNGSVGSDYLSAAYRFAAYKNDTFEIGPAIGLGYLWLKAGVEGTTLGGVTFERESSTPSPTGNLGAYIWWWPAKRVLVRGDIRYIIVKPENSEQSITEGRAGVTWYPWTRFGFGAQYLFTKFRAERDILSTELSGQYRYGGVQLVVSFAF
jgi:hypothetical protein